MRSALGRSSVVGAVTLALAVAVTGCSGVADHATGIGSSVASGVRTGVGDVTGGAVQRGMAGIAGGIDGALDSALRGAALTTDGTVPAGFPASAVPLVDGTVLGGGAGPAGSGWVVQIRVASVGSFPAARQRLTAAGFTDTAVRTDARSAFGLFRSDHHRVLLTFSTTATGVTATYVVTPR